jgi:hypothetical protein
MADVLAMWSCGMLVTPPAETSPQDLDIVATVEVEE